MASVPENVRVAIKNNLSTIPGLSQCSEWNLGQGFTTPCLFVVANGPTVYDQTYGRGTDRLTLVVRGIVGTVDNVGAQRLLSQWVAGSGASSVKTAIETDRTLGGLVGDLRVTDYLGDQYITLSNGAEYLAGDWSIDVLISP